MTPLRRFVLRRGEESEEVTVDALHGGAYRVAGAGRSETVEVRQLPDGRISLIFADGRQVAGRAVRRGPAVEVVTRRGAARVALADPLTDRMARSTDSSGRGDRHEEIRALMPGRVVQVCVKTGERVQVGDLLLVIEAMKMQNEIRAPLAGGIEQVRVSGGEPVESGSLLLSIRA